MTDKSNESGFIKVHLTIEELQIIIQSLRASWYQGHTAKIAYELQERLTKVASGV